MAKKRIIVACGGAVATSTVAATRIVELCEEQGISVEVVQCRVSEIASNCDNVDLIVTTARVTKRLWCTVGKMGWHSFLVSALKQQKNVFLRHLK
ncbi:hypothetical protein GCM10020331_053580 [Ectobacillus funiculus]